MLFGSQRLFDRPGQYFPRSGDGGRDLLGLDFGDAGGLKTYHDGLGVLRYNAHQLLENANLNDVTSELPSGWTDGGALGRTFEDQGGYQSCAIVADNNRPDLRNVVPTTDGAYYTIGFYIDSLDHQSGNKIVLKTTSELVNANGSSDDYSGAGWYAAVTQASGASITARYGLGAGGDATGTVTYRQPFVVAGVLPGVPTDGSMVRLDSFDWIGTDDGEEPVYRYRKSAYYWDGTAWAFGRFLTEPAATNEVRNNTLQGGQVSPYVDPTNWTIPIGTNGLTRDVQAFTTKDNIEHVRVRYHGTTTAAGQIDIDCEQTTAIAALQNEPWTNSAYMALVGGDLTGISQILVRMTERDAAGSFLQSNDLDVRDNLTDDLASGRQKHSGTLANASTAYMQPRYRVTYTTGQNVDFTLELGLPQAEENDHATSVNKTTNAAVTRVADTAAPIIAPSIGDEGSLVATLFPNKFSTTATNYIFKSRAANDADYIGLAALSGGRAAIIHRQAGVTVTDNYIGQTMLDEKLHKIAVAWNATEIRISLDGLTTQTAAVAGGFAQAFVESYVGTREGGLDPYSGFILGLDLYDYTMDASELENRSTV